MSEKQEFDKTKYTNDYIKKKYDRLGILLPKGMKEELHIEAKKRDMSVTAFILEAVKKELDKEA